MNGREELREFFRRPSFVFFRKFQPKRQHGTNGAAGHLILWGVDDEKSATLPRQFSIFLELGHFLSNLNCIEGLGLTLLELPKDFVLVVMCDVFFAEAVAKQSFTRLFSRSIGREGRYDMSPRTISTKRPWKTRLRQFLHLHDSRPETCGLISYLTTIPHTQRPFRIRVLLPAQYFFFGSKPVLPITSVNAAPAFKQLVSSQRNSTMQFGNFFELAIVPAARRSCTLCTGS